VEPQFASDLQRQCPPVFPVDGVVALDETSLVFDSAYYRDVVAGRGLLTIDSELGSDPATAPFVRSFAANPAAFFATFSSAFVKLSSFRTRLSANSGEVRSNCHSVN
jgi:peroxidase